MSCNNCKECSCKKSTDWEQIPELPPGSYFRLVGDSVEMGITGHERKVLLPITAMEKMLEKVKV